MWRPLFMFGILAIWWTTSNMAAAQVVTLRSGQHDGFVRLVLTLPEPAGWDFGRTADGYAFRSRIPQIRYDLSTVYQRIGHDRLSALWVDTVSGTLRLGISCDCHAIAEPFRAGIVLIDLIDGPPPMDSPFETALDTPGQVVPRLLATVTGRPRTRPRDFIPLPQVIEPWFLAIRDQPDLRPEPTLPLPLLSPPRDIAPLTDLLDQVIASPIATRAPSMAQSPLPAQQASATLPVNNAVATTQIRLLDPAHPATATSTINPSCPPDDWLAIDTWTRGAPTAREIALGRHHLLGEFDRPDYGRALELAQTYIHHGFGAEAREILRFVGVQGREAEILAELARIVDDEASGAIFVGYEECDGAAALWSALANTSPNESAGLNTAAVIRHYSALPSHLRRRLGPRLIDRLLEVGDESAANTVRNAFRRGVDADDPGLPVINAVLAIKRGDDPVADEALESVAHSNRDTASRALATLVASQLRRGERPESSLIATLDAMLTEHHGTIEQPLLQQALAQVLIVHGAHQRAFTEFATHDPELAPTLWRALIHFGSPAAVAEIALMTADASLAALPPSLRHEIAERLVDGGFARHASRWLADDSGPEVDLLRAEIALRQRNGVTAVHLLAGRNDTAAWDLKARAFTLLGDHVTASEAWQAAGDQVAENRAHIRAGNWERVVVAADSPLAILLGSHVSDLSATTADPAGQLAASRAMLNDSATLRTGIEGILLEETLPDPVRQQ